MEVVAELEKALQTINSHVSQIKWQLSATTRRRLETDILALCTGLRPVVMVDYGGKMPELQERLCTVLQLSQKESSILGSLRVMVIQEMIYLLHVGEFAEYVLSSLNSDMDLFFVDLEEDPPKMINNPKQDTVAAELVSVQRSFSVAFPSDRIDKDTTTGPKKDQECSEKSHLDEHVGSQSSVLVDLSSCLEESPVSIPTLNGWLLGYPVVYLFGNERIQEAIYNLSTKSLHLYKILICRKGVSDNGAQQELMSFSVPCDLSVGGKNEPWAESFLARMLRKVEKSKQVWKELHMEVTACYPQAIVL